MKYVGSKRRHAKELLPIILKERTTEYYVEPFVGGCNMIERVSGLRIGNDSNKYVIAMYKAAQQGWEPPDFVSEQLYTNIKDNKDRYPEELVGFVGIGCSYAGKWFGGFARGANSDGFPRSYSLESKRNLLKQIKLLKDVDFRSGDYRELEIPESAIIYCDPPYKNSVGFQGNFINHLEFWQWVRDKGMTHKIYVSEYNAPEDFVAIWQKEVYNTLDQNTSSKSGIEKLFIPRRVA